MSIVICPGIHDPGLTNSFLAGLQVASLASSARDVYPDTHHSESSLLVFPAHQNPVYSVGHVLEFLQKHCDLRSPLVLICFSAGVVGGAGAAWAWQQSGGKLRALIAFDGWGVPLYGNFPIHRFSHDYFTDWSSRLLGAGADSFYADPPVEHLELWRSPQATQGWWVKPDRRERTTATTLINLLLERYGVSAGVYQRTLEG